MLKQVVASVLGLNMEELKEDVKMNKMTDQELKESFNDSLDDAWGDIELCGDLVYRHSTVFESVDPVGYRCRFADWLDFSVECGTLVIDADGDYCLNIKEEST